MHTLEKNHDVTRYSSQLYFGGGRLKATLRWPAPPVSLQDREEYDATGPMLDGLDARMPVGGLSDNCTARIGLVADSTSTGSPFSSTSRDFLLNTLFVWRIEDRDESMLASVVTRVLRCCTWR